MRFLQKSQFGLRLKIVSILVLVLALLATGSMHLFKQQSNMATADQEDADAASNLKRLLLAMDFQVGQVEAILGSWSNWTAFYDHALNNDLKFAVTEMTENALEQAKFDWLIRLNPEGKIKDFVEVPFDSKKIVAEYIKNSPQKMEMLIRQMNNSSEQRGCGLMQIDEHLSIVCFSPLLPSTEKAVPRGIIAIGRHVDSEMLKEVSNQVGSQVEMDVNAVNKIGKPIDFVKSRIGSGVPYLAQFENKSKVEYPVSGLFDDNVGAIRITFERTTFLRAQAARNNTVILLMALIFMTGMVMVVVVNSLVVRKIEYLKSKLGEIVANKTWDGQIPVLHNDEIGQLTSFINTAIAEVHQKIIDLNNMSMTYALTGLSNRREFEARYADAVKRHERNNQPLQLILFDADFFKIYNDNYGHPAGDKALQEIASCLMTSARRPGDLVARLGGEEFCLLLEDTDLEGAVFCAENVLQCLVNKEITHKGNVNSGVMTLSAGMAIFSPGDTPLSLYTRADEALYEAKQAGRNRLCVKTKD